MYICNAHFAYSNFDIIYFVSSYRPSTIYQHAWIKNTYESWIKLYPKYLSSSIFCLLINPQFLSSLSFLFINSFSLFLLGLSFVECFVRGNNMTSAKESFVDFQLPNLKVSPNHFDAPIFHRQSIHLRSPNRISAH